MKVLLVTVYVTAVLALDHREYGSDSVEQLVASDEALFYKNTSNGQEEQHYHFSGPELNYQFQENPRERRRGKTLCRRKLRGRCVRRRKRCPENLPSQTSPGRPYCSKFHRCCHPAVCPDGFFNVPGSGAQCFKIFPNLTQTWEDTKSTCEAEGLELAKPDDPWALTLLLYETYGPVDAAIWLGAKGDGDMYLGTSSVMWIRDGTTLALDDPYWYPGFPNNLATAGNCLRLLVHSTAIAFHPSQVYALNNCLDDQNWGHTLCELVN